MEEIKEMFEFLKNRITAIDKKIDNSILEMQNLREENKCLREQLNKQGNRLEMMEREMKKNNIIIQGVEDTEKMDTAQLKTKIEELLNNIGVNINLDTAASEIKKIGTYQINKKRPILIKLIQREKKMDIIREAKKLKGTNVWISDDFTKQAQQDRKALIPHLKMAREDGRKAVLKYDKLIIDGEIYDRYSIKESHQNEIPVENKNKRTIADRSPETNDDLKQVKKATYKAPSKNY